MEIPREHARDDRLGRRGQLYCCSGLILLHAVLLACSAVSNSITFDEFAHLPAGCAYWKYGELSVYNQTPPLLRLLGSSPAMLGGVDVPDAAKFRKFAPRDRHWFYAVAFERANSAAGSSFRGDSRKYHQLFVLCRLAMIPISCLGAWIVFLWARRLYGSAAGLGACALWSLNPDVLAHGSIVGTDLGAAVAMLLAMWLWQRFLERSTPNRALAASVAIGAAHLCKFTALLLWPAMLAMAMWSLLRQRTIDRARAIGAGSLIVIVLVWVIVNLGYGYGRTFDRLADFDFVSRPFQKLQAAIPSLPMPLPRQLLLGLDAQKWEADTPRPAFLLGVHYLGSRWKYYPMALGVKLPAAVLALAALSLFASRSRQRSTEVSLLLALLIIAAGLVLSTNLNVGVRYLLPAYPLAFVLIGRLWQDQNRTWIKRSGWALIALLAIENASTFPRYLTFFNILAGGPGGGWKIVNDSNVDWGQGLLDLRRWMRRHNQPKIGLAYFGKVDPKVYGIDYVTVTDETIARGEIDAPYVAVSSYYLAGLPHRMPLPGGEYTPVTRLSFYRELQSKRPVDVVGNCIFIFRREDVLTASRP